MDYQMNNIVRIGSRDKRELYFYAIILRMHPKIYNEKNHGCIIIQVKDSLLDFAETIVKKFRWAGLKVTSKKKKEIENEKEGYTLKDAWEIKLRKIPVLELMGEEEDG